MKLDAVLALVAPFLATDAKPDKIKAAIIAADKKAKDEFPDKKEAYDKARDSMTKDEKEAFDAMSEEEKDKTVKDRGAKDKAAKDKAAKDAETDPENTNDTEIDAEDDLAPADPSTPSKGGKTGKPALDSAEVDRRIATAVAARDALHTAQTDVAPIVGARVFDSAGAAYKAGLEALGVDIEGVPESAYRAMLKLAKDRRVSAPIAMDGANTDEVRKLIPNYARL